MPGRRWSVREGTHADGGDVPDVDHAEAGSGGHGNPGASQAVEHRGHGVAQVRTGVQRADYPAGTDDDHRTPGLLVGHGQGVGLDLASGVGPALRAGRGLWAQSRAGRRVDADGRDVDHPSEVPLGSGIQEDGCRGRVHRTHLAALTGLQAEHGTCVEQGIDPVQRRPKGLVVGQVGQDDLDAIGVEVVEDRRRTELGGVAYDRPHLVTGGHGRSHAVGAEEPRGPGDRNLHSCLPGVGPSHRDDRCGRPPLSACGEVATLIGRPGTTRHRFREDGTATC